MDYGGELLIESGYFAGGFKNSFSSSSCAGKRGVMAYSKPIDAALMLTSLLVLFIGYLG